MVARIKRLPDEKVFIGDRSKTAQTKRLVGSVLGDVVVEAEIGRGGMGKVYRGWDRKLERLVALKTIRSAHRLSPAARARFLREARLLSRLDHPGICRIYGLLENHAGSFLVLEHIEGTTLAESAGSLEPHRRLDVAEQIARALAAAHREQIVHLDLKPDNVMLTSDDGVKILDFGISRSDMAADRPEPPAPALPAAPCAAHDGATTTLWGATRAMDASLSSGERPGSFGTPRGGSAMGTLRYMSPEQAAGGALGKASDLYSFGILLRELFTGRPAYGTGLATAELEERVLSAAIRPAPGLEADLGRLLDDLGELEPAARPSAEEAAERLCEIRLGPQRARRRRLRWLAAAAAGAFLAAAVAAFWWSRWQGSQAAIVAQQFGQEVKDIEWLMRSAHMMPLHDIRPEKARIEKRMTTLEETIRAIGALADGPGHYALGRGYLAIEDYEAARGALEHAWNHGYRTPETAYAYSLVLGHLLERELSSARRIADRELRRSEIERQAAEVVQVLSPGQGIGSVVPEYPQALLAFYERHFDEALRLARVAGRREPWLYEARTLEGDILRSLGYERLEQGDHAAARDAYDQADTAYRSALAVGESDPRLYGARCQLWLEVMELNLYGQGGQLRSDFEQAVDNCDQALAIDPDRATTYRLLSGVYLRWAEGQISQKHDPGDAVVRATAAARRAVELAPGDAVAYARLGSAYRTAYQYALRRRSASVSTLLAASASYQRALELQADLPEANAELAQVLLLGARWELRQGRSPQGFLDRARSQIDQALVIDLERAPALRALGELEMLAARWDAIRGRHRASSSSTASRDRRDRESSAAAPVRIERDRTTARAERG